MTSEMRSIGLGLWLLLAAAGAPAGTPAGTERVAALLATLEPPPAGVIPFTEKRMSALLEAPLELRGELQLGKDGAIDKHVLEPAEERVLVTARTLTLERDGKTRTIDLAGDRRWQAFHAGITGLLNRDLPALERVFSITLDETADGWTLQLRPRAAGGRNMITVISASGQGPRLLRLRLEQGENEWQEMTFPQAER